MKTIIISPWSRPLRDGKENPKHYPYWTGLIKLLHENNWDTIQIGLAGEKMLPCRNIKCGLNLNELAELINKCDTWISVDNFFQHYATQLGIQGICLFGPTNPDIFGYKSNINLLKDKSLLATNQFLRMEDIPFQAERFVSPEVVMSYLK